MIDRYMSRAVPACFDGETPEVVEGVEVAPVEETIVLFTEDQIAERLSARDLEWETRLSAKDGELASLKATATANTIERSLDVAATAGDAFNVGQLKMILGPHTSLVNGVPIVRIEGFELSPDEAVQWMRGQPEKYGNLFKSNLISGVGATGNAALQHGGRARSAADMSPQEYRAAKRGAK